MTGPSTEPAWTGRQIGARREYTIGDTVRIVFDRITPKSNGVEAWVEVHWIGNMPEPARIHFGRYDLMGSRTVGAIVSATEKADVKWPNPWRQHVTDIIYDVIHHHLEGDAPIVLDDVKEKRDDKWALRPLVLARGATALIARGGSMKSMLALAVGATVATGSTHYLGMKPSLVGPVLYLDWEDDEQTHAERLHALTGGTRVPGLYYRRETLPLKYHADVLAKRCDEFDIRFVIIDSVMLGRGGDAWGPQDTTAFFAAVRQLDRPTLLIDHKSKGAIESKSKGSYGSVVNENTIRMAWEVTHMQKTSDDGVHVTRVRLEQGKENHVGVLPDLGFEVRIESEREFMTAARIRQVAASSVVSLPAFPSEVPTADRIVEFLGQSPPATYEVLSEACDVTVDAARKAVSRDGRLVVLPGKPARVTLSQTAGRTGELPTPF